MEKNNDSNFLIVVSFFSILTVFLAALKLIGYVNWSWFVILSPVIIPFVLFIVTVLLVVIISVKKR